MNNEGLIGKYLSYIYRSGQCYIAKELEKYNIGSGQYFFLFSLYGEDGVSQETLTEKLKVDKATTGRAVQKLLEEGYVERQKDPKDRRAYKIYLTEKGKRMKPIIRRVVHNWVSSLLKDFNEEEKEIMLKLLNKMFENACCSSNS